MKVKVLQLNVNKNYPDLHIHIDEKGGFSIDEVRIERKTAKKEPEALHGTSIAASLVMSDGLSVSSLTAVPMTLSNQGNCA